MTAPRVGRFIDVQRLMVTWLGSQLPDVRAGTRVPADLSGSFVWVTLVVAPSNGDITVARFDLHAFTPGDPGSAVGLAGRIHDAMRSLDGQTVDGQPVYTVSTVNEPVPRFWSEQVDRMVGTYDLDLPVL